MLFPTASAPLVGAILRLMCDIIGPSTASMVPRMRTVGGCCAQRRRSKQGGRSGAASSAP